jgi:hypothetical protein
MTRVHRSLLFALLVLVLAAAPSLAGIVGTPIQVSPYITVQQAGAGSTIAEATANGLDWIADNHPNCSIVSYTTSNPLCSTIPTTGDPFCSVMITAKLLCWRILTP